jgi:hypothetical protein
MDMPIGKAKKLAERYFGIPKDVETKIKQRDMAAKQKLVDDLVAKYGDVPKDVTTKILQSKMSEAKRAAKDYAKDHLGKIPGKVDTKIGQPGIQKARVEARQYQQNELRKVERKVDTKISQPGMRPAQREAHSYQFFDLKRIERHIRTLFTQPGMRPAQNDTRTLRQRINDLRGRSISLNFFSNARALASKLGIHLARGGPVWGGGGPGDDQIPAWLSNGEYVINARAAQKNRKLLDMINDGQPGDNVKGFAQGGPVAGTRNIRINVGGIPGPAMGIPLGFGSLIGRMFSSIKDAITSKFMARVKTLVDKLFSSMGGGGSGTIPAGPGWGPVYAAARRAGARSFTTYAGHDQGASRSRDITPPSWRVANAVHRLQSVWYTIYRMMISSVTRANRAWLPFRTSHRRGDWMHLHHVHVTLRPGYSKGGLAGVGGAEVSLLGESGPERVLSAQQTKKFDRYFNAGAGGGGGASVININLSAPNYVGTPNDLIKTLTDASRRGQLDGVIRQAKRALNK